MVCRNYCPPKSVFDTSYTLSGKITSDDPVMIIKVRYEDVYDSKQHGEEALFNYKKEKRIIEEFCSYVQDKDPDIIVSVGDHYANAILDYLFARTEKLGLDLQFGREKNNTNKIRNSKHPVLQWIKGRLFISSRIVVRQYLIILDLLD